MAAPQTALEPLPMRHRTLVPLAANRYRVATSSGDSRQVVANTAYEAFKMAGFKVAVRIERLSNIDKIVLEKAQFTDEILAVDPDALVLGTGDEEAIHAQIKRRKNPIISADELDTMMRALLELAAAPAKAQPQASIATADVVAAPAAPSAASVAAPTPAESALSQGTETPGLTGMDVHGDGFDEIIPAAPAQAKPAAKPAEVKETPSAEVPPAQTTAAQSEAPAEPARELSPEEIDKLLSGK